MFSSTTISRIADYICSNVYLLRSISDHDDYIFPDC
jgi:hypothetical protein